jgi:hypothetical protein
LNARARNVNPLALHSRERREVVQLLRRIQKLLLELDELKRHEEGTADVRAKERALEQLRWRLATVARRTATADLDAAA